MPEVITKLKYDIDQIIDHMKNQGILFVDTSEEEAKSFLSNHNYYFKIKAYKKNYETYREGHEKEGQYINLDFAYLQELSTIDAAFRKFIIRTALDTEHFLKVQLLRHFENNQDEDGYSIVHDYFVMYPDAKGRIISRRESSYCFELIQKYQDCFALWNIVELLTFSDFINLYELYFRKYPSKDSMLNMLKPIQFLRNAAAHNNCLLNRLREPYHRTIKTNKKIENFVSEIKSIKNPMRNKKMDNPVFHDFVTLLYVFSCVATSEKTKQHTWEELKTLMGRFNKHKEYFQKNATILSYMDFLGKVVDFIAAM